MGVVEEGGRVATETVHALQASPICLVVMILSLAFAGMTFWALQQDRERSHAETLSLYERCFPLHRQGKDEP